MNHFVPLNYTYIEKDCSVSFECYCLQHAKSKVYVWRWFFNQNIIASSSLKVKQYVLGGKPSSKMHLEIRFVHLGTSYVPGMLVLNERVATYTEIGVRINLIYFVSIDEVKAVEL